MQRRRSFDGIEGQNIVSKKPTPTPLSSVSARVTTSPVPSSRQSPHYPQHQQRGGINVPKINTAAVPFPRGGRQIGQNHADTHLVRRSNSIERSQFRLPEGSIIQAMIIYDVNSTIICIYRSATKEKTLI